MSSVSSAATTTTTDDHTVVSTVTLTVASSTKTNICNRGGGCYEYFNILSFTCGIATTILIRVLYTKYRIKYRRNVSVVNMDQIDVGIVPNREAIGSVNTVHIDGQHNTFYHRSYDDLGKVF